MTIPNLTKIMERSLLTQKELNYVPSPKFRPSYLGTPCLRKIYYSYYRVEPDELPNLKGQKIFRVGDALHSMISQIYRDAGVLVDYRNKDGSYRKHISGFGFDYEFPLKDYDLEISSKIDAVLKIDGKLWIGEWKSCSGKKFMPLKGAMPEHIIQGAMYLYLFREQLKAGKFSHIPELDGITDVEGVIFLYLNKENLDDYKEFAYTDLELPFMNVIEKILKVKDHCSSGTLPPGTVDNCQWCDYKNKCAINFKPIIPVQQNKVESGQN